MRCSRVDLDPVAWVPLSRLGKDLRTQYQGREMDRAYGLARWRTPPEDPEGGCPGGWIRTRFVGSVMPYYRTRTQSGNRVTNRLYDTLEDPLLIEAVHYIEDEESRAIGHQLERIEAARG